MDERASITISLVSGDTADSEALASALSDALGGDAQVSVEEAAVPDLAGRSLDPAMTMQAISCTFTTVGVLIKVAEILYNHWARADAAQHAVIVAGSNGRVRLTKGESPALIAKKLRRVAARRSILSRVLKPKS